MRAASIGTIDADINNFGDFDPFHRLPSVQLPAAGWRQASQLFLGLFLFCPTGLARATSLTDIIATAQAESPKAGETTRIVLRRLDKIS